MKFKLVGLGELLWDLLPSGPQMGGAPANFAYHAHALGAQSHVISRVGNDEPGRELLRRLQKLGLPTESIEVDQQRPTGTVSVELTTGGQPHYHIHENVAWDAIGAEQAGREVAEAADAICFGTLAQRSEPSRSNIRALLAATPREALRILDVNLRQHYFSKKIIEDFLELANVLKINDAELPRLTELFGLEGDVRNQMSRLASRYQLRALALTRGPSGSLLLSEGRWSEHAGISTRVVDTIGAGDAFTAAMALGLLAGWELDQVNQHANEIAAYVCSCAGAMPSLPENLRSAFQVRTERGVN